MSENVTLEILRYRPEVDGEPHFQSYNVPYREDWVVLDALNHIKDHLTPRCRIAGPATWRSAAAAA